MARGPFTDDDAVEAGESAELMNAAYAANRGNPPPAAGSPFDLWQQAGGDRDQYLRLMREHGHLIPKRRDRDALLRAADIVDHNDGPEVASAYLRHYATPGWERQINRDGDTVADAALATEFIANDQLNRVIAYLDLIAESLIALQWDSAMDTRKPARLAAIRSGDNASPAGGSDV